MRGKSPADAVKPGDGVCSTQCASDAHLAIPWVYQHARIENALRVHTGLGGLQHLAVQGRCFLLVAWAMVRAHSVVVQLVLAR